MNNLLGDRTLSRDIIPFMREEKYSNHNSSYET